MDPKALRIFVLADTHDHLPHNLEALAKGADEIWHLGDLCAPSLLVSLENLGKPVTLVRGNCDSNFEWPPVVDLKRNGVRFRLVHLPPSSVPRDVDVLLHAHTHVPRNERKDDVLFLNPGCVALPKDGARPSVATLEVGGDGKLSWRLTTLR